MYRHVGCHHEHIKFCREGSYAVCTFFVDILSVVYHCMVDKSCTCRHCDMEQITDFRFALLACLACDRLHHLHAIVLWYAMVIHVVILMVQI